MPAHNIEAQLTAAGADSENLADFGSSGMKTDVIAESTEGSGVTLDGALVKDGGVTTAADSDLVTGSSGDVQLGSSGHVLLPDDSAIKFGDGPDINVSWDGSKLISGPPSGLWAGCPSALDPDPSKAIVLFDDFLTGVDTGTHWANIDDGGTGANTYGDVLGGTLNVVTAGANDDYHAMQSMSECFDLVDAKELWFEARFRVVEAATSQACWWFGLADTDTTGGMQTSADGPLADYDGILVYKLEGGFDIDIETSNATSQDIETTIATAVDNTWTRIGFHVSADATTAIVTAYFAVNDATVLTVHGTTMNLTRAAMTPLHVLFGIKSGGSAETLEVDYVKCVQIR